MDGDTDPVWPEELRISKARDSLTIRFNTGETHVLSAEMLRVMSPSAEVQGHAPSQRKTVGGKRDVMITGAEPVGNYAVRLTFDDLHDTGIFTWGYLATLGRERDERWATYEAELAEKGLSRDR